MCGSGHEVVVRGGKEQEGAARWSKLDSLVPEDTELSLVVIPEELKVPSVFFVDL